MIGKFKKGPRTPWSTFQYWLMSHLAWGGTFHGVTHVVGTHYEATSMIYRAFGAKIGTSLSYLPIPTYSIYLSTD